MSANQTIFGEVITFHKFSYGGRRGHVTSPVAILDHTRSRRSGPNLLFKFDFGILITFEYIRGRDVLIDVSSRTKDIPLPL